MSTPETEVPRKRSRKFYVHIDRNPDVEEVRGNLPVCMHEQEIIEAVHGHDVVLITGATGTGKTTQVPQFLVEDGFGHPNAPFKQGMIAVTQPRRVAAMACAERVAFEMSTSIGDLVGYQIRHEARIGSNTRVKFGTDGIFLREIENDIHLRKYSVVIVDEVHERSLNTDLLLSFLSRTIVLRKDKLDSPGPLKVIIMSATLDVEGVFRGETALFPNPPVVSIPSRQFPITVHFSKTTVEDYVTEAVRQVSKIHRRLPKGGVLVFLSGREEVERVCLQLRKAFEKNPVRLPDDGWQLTMEILPFYSLLPDKQQKRIFNPVKDDVRKVVVATNVAETSVTVPGITYVVDSGRVKERVLRGSGMGRMFAYDINWVSQASAEQRAGRAGRTSPGHCYRLYSSAVFTQKFKDFRTPEILRVPADAVVLRLRAMGILHVHCFPFPTRPGMEAIKEATDLLLKLGALNQSEDGANSTLLGVSPIGRELARLPVDPRLGRTVIAAKGDPRVLPFACRIGGLLSVTTIRREMQGTRERTSTQRGRSQTLLQSSESDVLTDIAWLCAAEHAGGSDGDRRAIRSFCERFALHAKGVAEAIKISHQVCSVIGCSSEVPRPPCKKISASILRSIVAGFPDRIARKMGKDEAAKCGVPPRLAYRAFAISSHDGAVFMHGSSSVKVGTNVRFVVYTDAEEMTMKRRGLQESETHDDYSESEEDVQELEGTDLNCKLKPKPSTALQNENEGSSDNVRRVVIRGLSAVNPEWIMEEARGMCKLSLVQSESPKYDVSKHCVVELFDVRYGPRQWLIGRTDVSAEEAEKLSGDFDRLRTRCSAFARALVFGRISPALSFSGSDGHQLVCIERLSDLLCQEKVFSLARFRRMAAAKVEELIGIIGACCNKLSRTETIQRWQAGLLRESNAAGCQTSNVNQVDESESDD